MCRLHDVVTGSPPVEIEACVAAISAEFERAASVTVLPYLRAEHADRLERALAAPLRAAIGDAIARLAELEGAIDELPDPLWQQVGDVCFAARGELRRAERAIQPCTASHADRLAACEAAQRKLRRALGAVLAALGRAGDHDAPPLTELAAEIESAVAVRRMYTKFRRSLPGYDTGEPASVRRALRYAAVSLAVMVGSSDFVDVRTQDRALLLELQHRILRWARNGSCDADGVQLYRDIVTAADLLRSINLRQELAANDQRMLRDAAAALATGEPAAALAAAGPALRALDGRDDALDALAERALREPPNQIVVAALRAAIAPLVVSSEEPRE